MKIKKLNKKASYSYENFIIALLIIIPISVAFILYLYSRVSIKHDLSTVLRNVENQKNGKLYLNEVFTWDWEEMCVSTSLETYPNIEKNIHTKVNRFFSPSTHYVYVVFDGGEVYFQIDEVRDRIIFDNTGGCYSPKDTIVVNRRGAFWVKITNEKRVK